MDLFSRIIVPVDGSDPSNSAVRLALELAAPPRDATVRFLSVFERDALSKFYFADASSGFALAEVLDAAQVECRRALDSAMDAARGAGVDATNSMRIGLAIDEIVAVARTWDASSIVIGTHGRTGLARGVLGSCAEGVLRKSPVPVLVAHAPAAIPATLFERILCAVDDSPAARRAFEAAVALAVERRAELHLLTVVQIADLYAAGFERDGFDPDGSMSAIYAEARAAVKRLAAEALAHGARIKPLVLGGADVAERIIACATAQRCGLIVLGTHGRGGIRRALAGSTAEGVLRSSPIPVLAFRDPAENEPAEHRPRDSAVTAR
jgi:nucleotide-binding universal stress UspA family protein